MSQPEVEEERRPCAYPPCTGQMEADLDGDCVVWACLTCGNETYGQRSAAPDACQVGVPVALQQQEPPGGPVFLGPTITRRPQ